jgi:hypothetical protein
VYSTTGFHFIKRKMKNLQAYFKLAEAAAENGGPVVANKPLTTGNSQSSLDP